MLTICNLFKMTTTAKDFPARAYPSLPRAGTYEPIKAMLSDPNVDLNQLVPDRPTSEGAEEVDNLAERLVEMQMGGGGGLANGSSLVSD